PFHQRQTHKDTRDSTGAELTVFRGESLTRGPGEIQINLGSPAAICHGFERASAKGVGDAVGRSPIPSKWRAVRPGATATRILAAMRVIMATRSAPRVS